MPTARESLLDAAFVALAGRPWPMVRMVDVAAAAGVSRQTLYNEFGSKDGLARALARRETDAYLRGVDQALSAGTAPGDRLAAVAEWTVRAARGNPLVRALLTGCWSERMPAPRPAPSRSQALVPAQRRADAGMLSPAQLSAAVRDRAAAALGKGRTDEGSGELAQRCELVVRLALSYVIAPGGEDVGRLVRTALRVGGQGAGRTGAGGPCAGGPGVSGPSPRAAVR
ncbi:TetR/AcrR family transcriptional regulator [Streptomyces sp. NPDC051219]|uniref:TetR/AcrR family transcriptional regulator n=1 Tax=Streptomyces sp. NPDC051219 TaxID=3155283 RepID=UPI00344263DB